MHRFYLVDDKIMPVERVPVDPGDRGLLYGFSLFETMLLREGRVVMLHRHLERLRRSARELGIQAVESEQLAHGCLESVRRAGVKVGVLRLTMTAGPGEGGPGTTLFTLREGVPYRPEQYAEGFSLLVLEQRRSEKSILVRHKTANCLENLLGRQEAIEQGYDEGLLLNSKGCVAEGTVSNVFLLEGDELLTPPVDAGLLPGIVRQLVLERAPGLGFRCREEHINVKDLYGADECFLTNSLMGIMPVTSLNGTPVGSGKPGRVTISLMAVYPPV